MIALLVLVVILLLIGGGIWGWPILAGILGISIATDKPGAVRQIRRLMDTYGITPDEVEKNFNAPAVNQKNNDQLSKTDIAKTLFTYLGGIFIVAGIGTYIAMFWESMGSAMRVSVTLGVGYILFVVLLSALYENKYPRAIFILSFSSVFMMAGGWFVLINEVFPTNQHWRAEVLFVFATMAVHFGVLFGKYQRTVFAFIALFFAYGFMQVGLDILGMSMAHIAIILGASLFLVGNTLGKTPQQVLAEPALLVGAIWLNGGLFDLIAISSSTDWASLITGICLIMTAYGLYRECRYPRLTGLGYLIGSVLLYFGLFELVQNTSIELSFLAVTASILYACVALRSRSLLITTVIAMLSYIGYYSEKHFADSLGWPITLVLMGIAFMGVGTIAIKLKRRI